MSSDDALPYEFVANEDIDVRRCVLWTTRTARP
jgi:hypothetical protein